MDPNRRNPFPLSRYHIPASSAPTPTSNSRPTAGPSIPAVAPGQMPQPGVPRFMFVVRADKFTRATVGRQQQQQQRRLLSTYTSDFLPDECTAQAMKIRMLLEIARATNSYGSQRSVYDPTSGQMKIWINVDAGSCYAIWIQPVMGPSAASAMA